MAKSTQDTILIHDISNDEVIERELNAEEIAQKKKDEAEAIKIKAEIESKIAARNALLDKLGITAEEAQLLLGGN